MDVDNNTCLNCGTPSDGRFCPHCGQSMATRRFTLRSFTVYMLQALTQFSGEFMHTALGLVIHPWKVVSNYVYGKRAGLVSPVKMLLLLALYWGILMTVLPRFGQSEQLAALNLEGIFKWLYGSITFQYLFLAIPVALGTRAVYRKDMRGRFNFVELIIATLYLACTFLIVDFVFTPVEIFSESLANLLIIGVTAAYGILSILKAFPQRNYVATALKLSAWCIFCGALLLVFLVLFALPMYKDYL